MSQGRRCHGGCAGVRGEDDAPSVWVGGQKRWDESTGE
jgi:hypothetical protein